MAKKIRGYSSYRGRSPIWRSGVTILLVAVILASFGVILLQRYMVLDDSGQTRIQFPWQYDAPERGGEDAESPPEGEGAQSEENTGEEEAPAIVEAPALRVLDVAAMPLTVPDFQTAAATAEREGYNALSVRLKDDYGWVYFDSPNILKTEVIGSSKVVGADTTEALRQLTASSLHSVARIACFLDWRASNGNWHVRLQQLSGKIYIDSNDDSWLDPANPAARAYLVDLARDAASLGFDEILLSAVCYPTTGRLDRIDYGDIPTWQNLYDFLDEVRSAIQPYGTELSIEVTPTLILEGWDGASGLSLDIATAWCKRIYSVVEPESVRACAEQVAASHNGQAAFLPELYVLPDPVPGEYVMLAG